jgi:cation:H+ antiporter
MWMPLAALIAGFALLVWSADRFVTGAAASASNFGVSPLLIGMIILGFGTSAPEMLVSATAAWEGNPQMGIGNAIGSNITNIALVLGATALVAPMTVDSHILRREFPALIVVMLIALMLLIDGEMGLMDGVILLSGLVALLMWMIWLAKRGKGVDPLGAEFDEEIPHEMPMKWAIFWVLVGIVMLMLSSQLLVWGAVKIAQIYGVSDLVIGLTIVAIGTSLPELAASMMGALKGEHDLVLGNIIGSNMFNILVVLALPGVISPLMLDAEVMSRDYPFMLGLTVALLIMAYGFRGPGRINRFEGTLLLGSYCAYMALLYFSAIK